MKITFPHMGNFYISLKCLFENLGWEVIVPPLPNKRTVELGVRYAPELACLPLKINIGNFLEAIELGADTIVMAGGNGPCRFGYYGEVQKEILQDLGQKVDFIILEPSQGDWLELSRKINYLISKVSWKQRFFALQLAWEKMKKLDELEKQLLVQRAYEIIPGQAEKIYRQGLKLIEEAWDLIILSKHWQIIKEQMEKGHWRTALDPLKVGIVGEIYTVLEPMVNLQLEKLLGERGVEVDRSIYLSHWIKSNLILKNLGLSLDKAIIQAARPYLSHFVGGHGQESVGETVLYARHGFDGVIHLSPFTCMPEIVAQSILSKVSQEMDIPVLSLSLDEHAGEAGLITRVEAFLELLARRREGGRRADGVVSGY